jgi:hypothetical protein
MGIKKEQKRKVDNVNIQVERQWEDRPPLPRKLFDRIMFSDIQIKKNVFYLKDV